MTEALRELIAYFGVQVESAKLEKFDKQVSSTLSKVKEAARVIGEAFLFREVAEFFEGPIEQAARIADLSNRLGIAAQDLQAWQFAAKLVGVDSEQAAHSLGLLNRTIGQAASGLNAEAGKAFSDLKVHLQDTPGHVRPVMDIVSDLADRFAQMKNQPERAAYAMKLFGREGQALLPILAGGREELQKTFAEFMALGGGMGDDFVRDAKRTDDELIKLRFGLYGLRVAASAVALPAIERIIVRLTQWVKGAQELNKHTYVLSTGMEFLAVVAGVKLVGSLIQLGRTFGIIKPGIMGTVGALRHLFWQLKVVALLYLAFDDFYTMMRGGESVIGNTIDKMYGIGSAKKFVVELKNAWKDLLPVIKEMGPSLGSLAKEFLNVLPGAIRVVVGLLTGFVEVIDDAFTGLRELYQFAKHVGANFHGDKKGSEESFDEMDRLDKGLAKRERERRHILGVVMGDEAPRADAGDDDGPGKVNVGKIGFSRPSATIPHPMSRAGMPASAPASVAITQQNTTNVEVHTSSDSPAAVGAAVGNGVSTSQRKANANALAAVRRR